MPKSWIQTWSGKSLQVRDPSPASVSLADVAHGLAGTIRFSGQAQWETVAQHCVLGARFLLESHGPKYALAFLLHEADEVFLPDIASPLKGWCEVNCAPEAVPQGLKRRTWKQLGALHEDAILHALDLDFLRPLIHSAEVKAVDLAMLAWEARDLFPTNPPAEWWPDPSSRPVPPTLDRFKVWSMTKSEREWLRLFRKLVKAVGE